jgi:hypothetical protein
MEHVGSQVVFQTIVHFWQHWLIASLTTLFCVSLVMRALIHYTIKREEWFSREFASRTEDFLNNFHNFKGHKSFYVMTKKLLERTYYELFEVRSFMKRRKPDFIMAPADRIFLIKQGTAWFVHDILRQIKWLRKDAHHESRIQDIARKTFKYNPCFSKVFGIFSVSTLNDFLNILPGTFIVLGIFGTFVGIAAGLPDLGLMDIADAAATKSVMDQFLFKMARSMNSSIYGILFSVTLHFINLFFSPTRTFVRTVDRFEGCLEKLWELSDNNLQPRDLKEFDEHRDPVEALAEEAVWKTTGQREEKVA